MKDLKVSFYKRISEKGFTDDEIPSLFSDLNAYFVQRKNYSVQELNRDMEDLGWGIQIIDQSLFKDILYYFENRQQYSD
jgi:hypothetical protein